MPKAEKVQRVQEIVEKLTQAKVAIFSDYRGLNVKEITALRRKLREVGADLKVVKNTLTSIALREKGITGVDSFLEGPTALTFGFEDPAQPAKVLVDFAKENKALSIKAGILDARIIDVNDVQALAALPPRDVLLAKLLGTMQAPLSGFANVLQGTIRKFAYALEAVRAQKESSAEA